MSQHPGGDWNYSGRGVHVYVCNFCEQSEKHESWEDCARALLQALNASNKNLIELAAQVQELLDKESK